MAQRSRPTITKRQREQARIAKQKDKLARRDLSGEWSARYYGDPVMASRKDGHMRSHRVLITALILTMAIAPAFAQRTTGDKLSQPAPTPSRPAAKSAYVPPRTPWGDP